MAKQALGTGTTRAFVVTESDQPAVLATYAWCMASVGLSDLPKRLCPGAGSYPQPIALLARLGVDERQEGQGLGRPQWGRPWVGRPLMKCSSLHSRQWLRVRGERQGLA
jgi:hypothetical protein